MGRRERALRWQKNYADRLRVEVFGAYGDRCTCCGETDPAFLTLDHVNNDGAAHRRALGTNSGHAVYRWLRDRGFPQEGFQLLCWNCNHAKYAHGVCPHQKPAARSEIV
jgi:hypothetical protein